MVRRIGVLALQGGYAAHSSAVRDIGLEAVEVREAKDLDGLDGLILPGGESTTHLKLIHRFDLEGPLRRFVDSGRPILATCAGLILAARQVSDPEQKSFGWLDISVGRNGWGRQVHSFESHADKDATHPIFGEQPLPLLFIRAPRLNDLGEQVDVLARFEGEPVMVRTGVVAV